MASALPNNPLKPGTSWAESRLFGRTLLVLVLLVCFVVFGRATQAETPCWHPRSKGVPNVTEPKFMGAFENVCVLNDSVKHHRLFGGDDRLNFLVKRCQTTTPIECERGFQRLIVNQHSAVFRYVRMLNIKSVVRYGGHLFNALHDIELSPHVSQNGRSTPSIRELEFALKLLNVCCRELVPTEVLRGSQFPDYNPRPFRSTSCTNLIDHTEEEKNGEQSNNESREGIELFNPIMRMIGIDFRLVGWFYFSWLAVNTIIDYRSGLFAVFSGFALSSIFLLFVLIP